MKFRKQLLITTAALALAPIATQATPTTWVGGTSGFLNAWTTAGNWTAGVPTTTSAVTINSAANTPLITTAVSLNATSGANVASLAITSGGLLTIGTGGSLAMGTHAITLSGGTLTSTGSGTMTGTGAIQGFVQRGGYRHPQLQRQQRRRSPDPHGRQIAQRHADHQFGRGRHQSDRGHVQWIHCRYYWRRDQSERGHAQERDAQ